MEIFPSDSPFLAEDTRKNRWAIPYSYEALNCRTETLLARNRDLIEGARILDLGCHFGSFAWACLKLGADHVLGADPEERLIEKGRDLFYRMQADPSQYRFVCADASTILADLPDKSVDTLLCLGMLYYVLDPFFLLQEMARVARKAIILDTFTARYAACMTKDGQEMAETLPEEAFDLPLMLCPLTQAEKKDYTLQKGLVKPGRTKKLAMLSLPSEALLEYSFRMVGLDAQRISWEHHVVNTYHWRDFISFDVKLASHWADVYHTGLRASWVLFPEKQAD